MVVAKAHNMLLNCGIAAGVDLTARGHPAAGVRGLAPGQDDQHPAGPAVGPVHRVGMGCLWLRIGPAMISQTPSSALPDCRPANPRGPASAKAPTAATASPEITLTAAALPPAYCRVMNRGEMATHSPVSMPSAAAAWAPTPRQVAGSGYPAAAPAAAGTAGTAGGPPRTRRCRPDGGLVGCS